METEVQTIVDSSSEFYRVLSNFVMSFGRPAQIYQLVILLGCFVLAWLVRWLIGSRIEAWMRGLEGRPKWQLRWLLVLHARLQMALFAIFAWASSYGFTYISVFPSRRYLISLGATIATAWIFIRLSAQLIRNRFLRRLVIYAMTIYATLYYAGLIGAATAFLDGIAIVLGDFRLSALSVIKALVITGLLFTAARLISTTTSNRIKNNEDISPSMRVLAIKFLQIGLYGAAFFIGLKAVGFDLTGLAVLSGAIGVGLGFGLQKVVSNLVSGVIILLDKSIKPGDVISIGDTFGWINALGARYVSITTRDGKEYLIPNEDLITGQVVNWSHSNELVRIEVTFGCSYADDPRKVREVAISATRNVDRVLMSTPPVCHVVSFGDSSIDYGLRFWISDPTSGLANIKSEVYLALWDAFKEHGITIPFPQREVRILGDGQPATAAPE